MEEANLGKRVYIKSIAQFGIIYMAYPPDQYVIRLDKDGRYVKIHVSDMVDANSMRPASASPASASPASASPATVDTGEWGIYVPPESVMRAPTETSNYTDVSPITRKVGNQYEINGHLYGARDIVLQPSGLAGRGHYVFVNNTALAELVERGRIPWTEEFRWRVRLINSGIAQGEELTGGTERAFSERNLKPASPPEVEAILRLQTSREPYAWGSINAGDRVQLPDGTLGTVTNISRANLCTVIDGDNQHNGIHKDRLRLVSPGIMRNKILERDGTGSAMAEEEYSGAEARSGPRTQEELDVEQAIALSLANQGAVAPSASRAETYPRSELDRAIALSLENQGAVAPAVVARRSLDAINKIIQVFNPTLPGDELASEFLTEQEDYNPFIVRASNGQFSGDAIDWPSSSSSGKEFIECKDNSPSEWQGNTYKKWIKPNARRFIKITILGSPTLVIKPAWYDTRLVPGTKYFRLVLEGNVKKFMSTVLSSQNLPEDFSALGADHCNQTGPVGVYVLQEIPLSELNTMIPASGGKKSRKKKTKQQKKTKQKTKQRKTRRNKN
jgi:hypothetical protein